MASPNISRMVFQKQYLLCYILLTDQISLTDCLYFLKYVYCNCFLPGSDVISYKIDLIFLMKPLVYNDKKVKTKISISQERKKLLR